MNETVVFEMALASFTGGLVVLLPMLLIGRIK